jgi:anti-anti-sigma regulatory factor
MKTSNQQSVPEADAVTKRGAQDRVRRVRLVGRYDRFSASALLRAVAGEVADGELVLADLAEVTGLDWSGVNALILSRGRIERVGGHLRVVNVSSDIRRQIDVMGSTHHLDITPGAD